MNDAKLHELPEAAAWALREGIGDSLWHFCNKREDAETGAGYKDAVEGLYTADQMHAYAREAVALNRGTAEPYGYVDEQGLATEKNSTNFRMLLDAHRAGKPRWSDRVTLLYAAPPAAAGVPDGWKGEKVGITRCRRCGDTADVTIYSANFESHDRQEPAKSCCRSTPCEHPGVGPCDMPSAPQPSEANTTAILCIECCNPTMHMGNLCFACSKKAKAQPSEAAQDDDETPEPTLLQIEYARGHADGVRDGQAWLTQGPDAQPIEQRARMPEATTKLLVLLDQAERCDQIGMRGVAENLREAHEVLAAALSQPQGERGVVDAEAKTAFWREWAIDGMPKDKQRLAEAAWEAALGVGK